MLDIMRRHASSWFIKFILGAIIVTFIFFFGYSSYRKGMRGGRVGAQGQIAASVNGIPISEQEFEFFFNNTFERMKSSFAGKEIPDFARKLAESSTLQQLVGREIALQLADELGIVIPDAMLADTIRDAQTAQQGGEFDPIAYRHQFLPYFRNRFGMDYEQFVRQDLRLTALETLLNGVDRSAAESPKEPSTAWTFESVLIDPQTLVESKAIADAAAAKPLAEKLALTPSKEWPAFLKPLKINATKVGPFTLAERTKLLDGKGRLEDYEKIFAMTPEHAIVDAPIELDGKLYVLRLVNRQDNATPSNTAVPPGEGFWGEWMGKLLAKAKVKNYREQEQPKPSP